MAAGRLTKAVLEQLQDNMSAFAASDPDAKRVVVQFNPESLSLSYSNQISTPNNTGSSDQSSCVSYQYVGSGSTTLTLTLLFDVNQPGTLGGDVRAMTERVLFFFTPRSEQKGAPPVRFKYGTFKFDGVMTALDEKIDMFSEDGRPLRATMNVTLQKQKIEATELAGTPGATGLDAAGGEAVAAGTTAFAQAKEGARLADVVKNGGAGWQEVAEANGIENPRSLVGGALLDLDPRGR